MPTAVITAPMPSASACVFELLHDYNRRLEWDTLLREARLTRGHSTAAVGATSSCVGKAFFGLVGIETRYVTFVPAVVAAVVMINRPPLFQSFAASIRHHDTLGGSTLTYKLTFTARPRRLRWLLEPLILRYLRHETQRRLSSLSRYLSATAAYGK